MLLRMLVADPGGQPDETARDDIDPDDDDEAGEDGAQHPLARCHEQAAGDEQSDEPTRPDIWPRWRPPEGGDGHEGRGYERRSGYSDRPAKEDGVTSSCTG